MQVSFIIPLYNCLPLTQAMLASLRATLPPELEHEIIFVDDGSTDGTRAWLPTLPAPCRAILNEKNLGFAGACNRGAAAATGEFLFFLNNDLVLLPHWLEPMLAAFIRFPQAGLVGNVQLNHANGVVDHTGIFFNHKGKPEHATGRGPGWQDYRPVTAVTGACFGLRHARWTQLGGFDEDFVNGCVDVDLGLRAGQQGLVNYVAQRSIVRHHISASTGRKLRDEQNTARLVRRWRSVILPQVAHSCSRAVLASVWDDPRPSPDPDLAREALLYTVRLLPRPTRSLFVLASASLDLEMSRWDQLVENPPAHPAREIVRQPFPAAPENPPVY